MLANKSKTPVTNSQNAPYQYFSPMPSTIQIATKPNQPAQPFIDLTRDADILKEQKNTILVQIKQEALRAELETEMLRAQVESLKLRNQYDQENLKIIQSGHYLKMQELEEQVLLLKTKNDLDMEKDQKELRKAEKEMVAYSLKDHKKEEELERKIEENFIANNRNSIFG
ncbi:MAG: hypothetical protein WC627_00090 [Legionella sp.]|jgi:hypothetical protein